MSGRRKDKEKRRRRAAEDERDLGDGKVIRDSFTMPSRDHLRLEALKARCIEGGVAVKKSELLRAGVRALDQMGDAELLQLMARLEPVKTGRPPKDRRRGDK